MLRGVGTAKCAFLACSTALSGRRWASSASAPAASPSAESPAAITLTTGEGNSTPTPVSGSNSSSSPLTSSSTVPNLSTTTVVSSKKTSKNATIVTATTLHAGEAPKTVHIDLSTPDESGVTPQLEPFAEPKPFITPKQIRDFTFSVIVGFSVMGIVHYILSTSIAENYDEELEVLKKVTRDTSAADKLEPKPKIPPFVAPSSYSALKKKMEEETRISREKYLSAKSLTGETPVLHQELSQRMMLAWNRSLSNVEQSAAALTVQYHKWRVAQMKRNVKSMLEAQSLELVELKQLS